MDRYTSTDGIDMELKIQILEEGTNKRSVGAYKCTKI